jgi:TonB family protein
VAVNARTGEVRGWQPYSTAKIAAQINRGARRHNVSSMYISAVVLFAFLCVGSFAQAQTPAVYPVGNGRTAPVLTARKEPGYSEEARIAKLQGAVTVSLTIGEDGKPRDVRVVKPLGLGLDEAAVAAVSDWQFTPGTKDGKPGVVQATIEVNFRLLDDPRYWYVSGARFTVPAGAERPRLVKAPQAETQVPGERATVRVAFDVDPQGVPVNIRIANSSDPKLNQEAADLIGGWRFEPASNNGAAIEAHAEFDLVRKSGK